MADGVTLESIQINITKLLVASGKSELVQEQLQESHKDIRLDLKETKDAFFLYQKDREETCPVNKAIMKKQKHSMRRTDVALVIFMLIISLPMWLDYLGIVL